MYDLKVIFNGPENHFLHIFNKFSMFSSDVNEDIFSLKNIDIFSEVIEKKKTSIEIKMPSFLKIFNHVP